LYQARCSVCDVAEKLIWLGADRVAGYLLESSMWSSSGYSPQHAAAKNLSLAEAADDSQEAAASSQLPSVSESEVSANSIGNISAETLVPGAAAAGNSEQSARLQDLEAAMDLIR